MMQRLPREAYTEESWFASEQRELFADAWVAIGTVSDFLKEGDYRTTRCGRSSLIVVNGNDGTLRAFHNVCRHRGAELVERSTGNCRGALTCPYHRWTYRLDGKLAGIPNRRECFPALESANLALKPASVGAFGDIVFANPNPAADFDAWIAPLRGREYPHDLSASDVREGVPLTYAMKCDWKVFVENALDGYHLSHLHARTLGGPAPSDNAWEKLGGHMTWHSNENGSRHRLPSFTRPGKRSRGVIRSASTTGYPGVYYLFPTTFLLATPFGFSVSNLHPRSAGRCSLVVRQWVGPGQPTDVRRYVPGYDKKTDTITSDQWTKHPLKTGDFQTEDVWICESVQRGLESPAYEHGPLALGTGGEEPLLWFHSMLAARESN